MRLRKKHLFRKYEGFLFYHEDVSREDKVHGLYLLLKPILVWAKQSLIDIGLEPNEADSEIFILSEKLFSKYDKERSSIVPYLEQAIDWEVSAMLSRISKIIDLPYENIDSDLYEEIDESFYFKVPNILIDDRYVGKSFTRSEKYLIYKILISDDNKLSVSDLSKECCLDRKTMRKMLNALKDKMNGGL